MSFLENINATTQTEEFESNMRALESQQGSTEWKRWRGKGIGSSDASTLLGRNPWKTLQQLFDDKLGRGAPFEGNARTRRGQDLEPIARRIYEERCGDLFKDDIEVHRDYPFIRASYDGVNRELKKVLEIKSPGQKAHADALAGRVPDYYMPQCQWLLMVAGYEDLDYVSFDGDNIVVVPVKADPVMQNELIERAIWFWDCVVQQKPPSDFTLAKDLEAELVPLLEEFKRLDDVCEDAKAKLALCEAHIKAMTAGLPTVTLGRAKISRTSRKGAVNYALIPELTNVDLEPYRKPDIEVFQIRIKDDVKEEA